MQTNKSISNNRWIILIAILIVTFMCTLDGSIVNISLPIMSKTLNVTMVSIEWVVTSYLIAISASILIFGRLGDIIGKTKIFKIGLAIFTLGSFLCGLSHSLYLLVISRVIQAIGAAAIMANNQGIITHIFPPGERGKALGLSGTFVALGAMVGPGLGGLILSKFSWEYIFLINLPIGIIVFVVLIKILPNAEGNKESLDIKGGVLFAISIVALFAGFTEGQRFGYNNPFIIASFIISLLSFLIFIYIENRISIPLLDLNLFKNSLFSISIFCAFISFVGINTFNFIQPFYLQNTLSLPPQTTGLIMMIYPIVLAITAPLSGSLSDKIGSEILTFFGLILLSIGLFLMSFLGITSPIYLLIIFIIFMAVGNGLFTSPNNSLVMSTAPKDKLGIAGSVNSLIRNLGSIVGVTLSTSLLYNRMSYKIGYHVSDYIKGRDDIFIYGMKNVYIFASIICLIGTLLTAYRLFAYRRK